MATKARELFVMTGLRSVDYGCISVLSRLASGLKTIVSFDICSALRINWMDAGFISSFSICILLDFYFFSRLPSSVLFFYTPWKLFTVSGLLYILSLQLKEAWSPYKSFNWRFCAMLVLVTRSP